MMAAAGRGVCVLAAGDWATNRGWVVDEVVVEGQGAVWCRQPCAQRASGSDEGSAWVRMWELVVVKQAPPSRFAKPKAKNSSAGR